MGGSHANCDRRDDSTGAPAGCYPKQFRKDAAAQVIDQKRTVADVAREFGVVEQILGNWVRQERIDRGLAERTTTEVRRMGGGALDQQIVEVHCYLDDTYGSPRMTDELRARRFCANDRCVERVTWTPGAAMETGTRARSGTPARRTSWIDRDCIA